MYCTLPRDCRLVVGQCSSHLDAQHAWVICHVYINMLCHSPQKPYRRVVAIQPAPAVYRLSCYILSQMVKKERRAKEVVTREYTLNLHKNLHKTKFKSRAPKAVKVIRQFAQKTMGTSDVRLDVKLNKVVWSKGIRNVPFRLRIVISRRRNDDEDAKVGDMCATSAQQSWQHQQADQRSKGYTCQQQ